MAQYALCYVCGKATRVKRAKTCLYCGKYVCKEHRFNGLCPNHTHTMSKEHSDALNKQDIIQDWTTRIAYWIGIFSFIGIFGIFFGDNRILGFVSLGIFVVVVGSSIIIFKRANKIRRDILEIVDQKLINQRGPTICLNCKIRLPAGSKICPKCGIPLVQHSTEEYLQERFPTTAITISSAKTPPPPTTPPSTYSPPPPPPQQIYTSNQSIDDALEEITNMYPESEIKVTSFYDEATNSGFHICSNCGIKFETKDNTSRCPYCNEPIYGTR